MKKIIRTVILIVVISTVGLVKGYAQIGDPPPMAINPTPAALKAAEDMLMAQHMDKQVRGVFTKVFNLASPSIPAEMKEKFISYAKVFIDKYSKWEDLKPNIIRMYAETYTIDELKQLEVFYKTPIGQKLAENQIDMSQQVTILCTQIIANHKQDLSDNIK